VPRLKRAQPAEAGGLRVDPERTVLITGGTGDLGALVAKRLVERYGARSILLTSRSGSKAAGIAELEAELGALGAQVRVVSCDVSDRAQVQAMLQEIPSAHPLGVVVHAAGVLDDGLVENLTAERMTSVLRPKVDGAFHLHELTMDMELSAFILFSSAAATLGGAGQGNYAAANAFLDALAAYRRSHDLVGVSLGWGLWDTGEGMGAGLTEVDRLRLQRNGTRPMGARQGLDLFDASLATDAAFVLPVRLEMAALRDGAAAGTLPPVFRGLVKAQRRSLGNHAESLAGRLAKLGSAEREQLALEIVHTHTATVLGHASGEAIEPTRTFKELGFDSLTAVELRNRLVVEVGIPLPATLVFDNPTPNAVAGYLLSQIEAHEVGVGVSLDDELAELEQRLSQIASEGSASAKVAVWLRGMLRGLDRDEDAPLDDEDVQSASADEVLQLIDREFGSLERHGVVMQPGERND
jgi:NADP-dependent 3-hydroxy acid dehydrogenase YdfG/acyl carrier protein